VVFQNYSLLPWMTMFENVMLAVDQVFPNWSAEKKRAQVDKYIAMVNLTPARDKKPGELSGGMRTARVGRASVGDGAAILLLDEPLGALDALTRKTLQDEIVRIWEQDKRTVVLITNDVDEGILMADRIVPLSAGPNATLGPSIEVHIPRPRDRKAINHDPEYKEIRRKVIGYLLGEGGKQRTAVMKKLFCPTCCPKTSASLADYSVPGASRAVEMNNDSKPWRSYEHRQRHSSRSVRGGRAAPTDESLCRYLATYEDLSDSEGSGDHRQGFQSQDS
jgi:nitrate/nitrite transport system ATP-binding protein